MIEIMDLTGILVKVRMSAIQILSTQQTHLNFEMLDMTIEGKKIVGF